MHSTLCSFCGFICLLLISGLIGCSDSPEPPRIPSTAIPTPTIEVLFPLAASPQPTSRSTPTPTPQKTISQWLLSGSYVHADMNVPCVSALSPDSFILGATATTCLPAETGGLAEILVQAPSDGINQIALLHIVCTDTANDCRQAVQLVGTGGTMAITVDDQLLWQADCLSLSQEECGSRFLTETFVVAFAAADSTTHHVQIKTSPYISWQIADIQITWQPIPEPINGVAFSPFRDCQNPHWGPFPSLEQVREDLLLVQHMGNAVRTYSSMGVQGQIPALAHELGLRVIAGAWLGPDKDKNEEEITALIQLVQQQVGIESVIVGNEVLLRGDLTEAELIGYIERVQEAVDVPVTTAETIGHLLSHPELIKAVDYVLVHIYAYWDGVAIENAAQHTLNMYRMTQNIAMGKPVVIGETGWPSNGPANHAAIPTVENEQRFWHEFLTLARRENIAFFVFAAFDELWKTEGGVGPYWGIFDSERANKFDLQSVYVPMNSEPLVVADIVPVPTPTRGVVVVTTEEELFPVFVNYAAFNNHFAPSGYMGDYQAIQYNECARLTDVWEETSIEIRYDPGLENEVGWAGIYWQEPENNWGYYPEGYDLESFAQLRFRARSSQPGSQVQFFVGGVYTGTHPSSISEPIYAIEADSDGFVTLTAEWQEFHIALQNADLSHVIDGFGWVAAAEKTPTGVTVYVDDIVFSQQRLPTLTPVPTPTFAPPTSTPTPQPHSIYAGTTLASGYDMGVDTGPGRLSNWVTDQGGFMCMNYPGGQDWGAVFITNGVPQPPGNRLGRNLATFTRLYVELKGLTGNQSVQIGIKDNSDPDNGTETKFTVIPPLEWQGYSFSLADFGTADLSNLYVMIEFVFGNAAADICFRNVMYLP